jgi:thiosulfate/3-mercaptopyruvate sulfurtransferase
MSRIHFLDAPALHAQLEAAPDSVVVVDCRFNLLAPHAGFRSYLEAHIPGARYAHLDKDLASNPTAGQGRHPLPARSDFVNFLGALGIDNSTRVVACDDQGGAIAARLWWLLGEVGHGDRWLLDGGLAAWRTHAYPLTDRLPDIAAKRYVAAETVNAPCIEAGQIPAFISGGGCLLDARAPARFAGREEPIDPVAGHVPGAVNLPFTAVLDDASGVRSTEQLKRRLEDAVGDRRADRIAVMCGSGVTACMLAAALESAGFGRARLYAGSWSEWIRDPARPVATLESDAT